MSFSDLPEEIQKIIFSKMGRWELQRMHLAASNLFGDIDFNDYIYLTKLSSKYGAENVFENYKLHRFDPKGIYDYIHAFIGNSYILDSPPVWGDSEFSAAVGTAISNGNIDIARLFASSPAFTNGYIRWRDLSLQQAVVNRDCEIFQILLSSQRETPQNWKNIVDLALRRKNSCILQLIRNNNLFLAVMDEKMIKDIDDLVKTL